MKQFIAYYRVSTQEQGDSRLGLEAQEAYCKKHVAQFNGELVNTYQEIESGNNNYRPQLLRAIKECKKKKCTLLIAKLDRLSRNAAFIFTLRDSRVDFVCADMPDANSVTIGIMAVLAQDERERISQRTKDALAALKARGVKLGNPNMSAIAKANNAKRQASFKHLEKQTADILTLITMKRELKMSYPQIAEELNALNLKTKTGKDYEADNVRMIYNASLRA